MNTTPSRRDPAGYSGLSQLPEERYDLTKARERQELRRSNASVPIPAAQHKRSRSWAKQQLRESNR